MTGLHNKAEGQKRCWGGDGYFKRSAFKLSFKMLKDHSEIPIVVPGTLQMMLNQCYLPSFPLCSCPFFQPKTTFPSLFFQILSISDSSVHMSFFLVELPIIIHQHNCLNPSPPCFFSHRQNQSLLYCGPPPCIVYFILELF